MERDTRGIQMISKGFKRLAEVDFPIAVVSKHSARDLPAPRLRQAEKSVRQDGSRKIK